MSEKRKRGRPLGLSDEDQTLLRRMWNESGMTQDELAVHFGWNSRGPVARWIERFGLEPRRSYAKSYVDGLKRDLAKARGETQSTALAARPQAQARLTTER